MGMVTMSYKDLANAVVIQAYHDYAHGRLSLTAFKAFVNSDWFLLLTRGCIAPAAILKRGVQQRDDIVSRRLRDRERS